MADFLVQLCDTDRSNPFPVWDNGSVGYCFTQLVLNVVPHIALAFASACYLNTPRSRWQTFTWSWECRIIISFVQVALFLIDVVAIIFFPNMQTLWLEVLVDSVAVIAWLVHGLAVGALSKSQYGRSLGPAILPFFAVLPAPAFIINLIADCQTGQVTCSDYFSSWLRFILTCAQLTLLLAYLVVLIASQPGRDEISPEQEPLLQGGSSTPEGEIVAEDGASWVSRLFYFWMNPIMKRGYNLQINQPSDVYQLPPKLSTHHIEEHFQKCLQKCVMEKASREEKKQHKPESARNQRSDNSQSIRRNSWRDQQRSEETQKEAMSTNMDKEVHILTVLHKAFGFRYYCLGLLKFAGSMLGFAGPLLLNLLVSFMESGTQQMTKGIWYTLGLFLSTFAGAILLNQFNYQVMMVGLMVRSAIISTIYRKALHVNVTTLSKFSVGEIVNFMSTDTDRIVNFFPSFHEVWGLPFQFSITLYLLYRQIGVTFLGGLVVGLLLVPLNKVIANIIMENSRKLLGHKDSRVRLMSEILFGMRVIKFYTWENHFINKIANYREKELGRLKVIKYLDAVCVYMWAALPIVISILTFVTYALLGHQLTAAKVFTALALVGMLIQPLNNFPWVLNGIIQAKVSLDRIQRFLQLSDQDLSTYYMRREPDDPDSAVELHDATFSWKPSETSDDPSDNQNDTTHDGSLELLNLNVMVKQGELIGVVGKVGCGKSSLLAAILGELNRLDGEVYVSTQKEGFGLAAQEPWIQFTTIRENILCGNKYDATYYEEVIKACALSEDLNVLPLGDQTEVGESGVALSGGQKARVALARAVYMNKELYLLDDPLAAVDNDVATHLMENCILGLLKDKTVILCTHRTEFLDKADMVMLMENGKIVETGTPDEILSTEEAHPSTQHKSSKNADAEVKSPKEKEGVMPVEENLGEIHIGSEEVKKVGALSLKVYWSYWLSIGKWLAFSVLVCMFLMQVSRNLSDWWLSYWISQAQHKNGTEQSRHYTSLDTHQLMRFIRSHTNGKISPHLKFYLTVYGCIAVVNTVFTAARAFLFAYGAICAAVIIHNKLLGQVLKATTLFFDTTPIGRIVNRFSTDLYSVDDTLPFILNIFLATSYGLFGTILMISYSLPWILLVLVPLIILYFYIQRYYRFTSRELKRLTAITLSPIYTQFSETLSGLTTIRAFRAVPRFEKENNHRLELNQRCLYVGNTAVQWLDIRLQLIGVTVVTSIAVIAVIEHGLKRGNPGLVGLALSYALSITSLLSGVVASFTQTEMQMVSVERLDEYTTEIPIEPQEGNIEVPPSWPQHGEIMFKDAVLSYQEGLPIVLDGINLKINAGEKVGIVGRTGSGKSTLFLALFRLVELNEGQIFIDNIDIKRIRLLDLRSKLAIIPQDPFLFSGTVRENLDPLGHHTELELKAVLEECHLLEVTERMGGLDAELGDRGRNLSIGQRQLICLARALLTRAKILCIDEATASIDRKTDQLLQETIRQQFADKTVLTIAHRLNTIMDSNRVLVLDAGRVKEFDSPTVLSRNEDSFFYGIIHDTEQ
ncbi:multidrug resistance-associated protein 7 [Scyliorhinus canicula]|uniref:multidrug resistance-associated protein 7 n=1 Tax=Scyliorhinus canicula TaxID=7830 RepID=UPI0018F29174|nr:multidrug resistance-associated protein 7 [Scyliorhinus canicula]